MESRLKIELSHEVWAKEYFLVVRWEWGVGLSAVPPSYMVDPERIGRLFHSFILRKVCKHSSSDCHAWPFQVTILLPRAYVLLSPPQSPWCWHNVGMIAAPPYEVRKSYRLRSETRSINKFELWLNLVCKEVSHAWCSDWSKKRCGEGGQGIFLSLSSYYI